MRRFLLCVKLDLWKEVHTDGYSGSERIDKFLKAADMSEAKRKAEIFVLSLIRKYPKDTSPSRWEYHGSLLVGLEIELLPVGDSLWSEAIGEESLKKFQKTLRERVKIYRRWGSQKRTPKGNTIDLAAVSRIVKQARKEGRLTPAERRVFAQHHCAEMLGKELEKLKQ